MMKKANKRDKSLIEEVYDYLYTHLCCNDYHSEDELDESILTETPIAARYGEVLIDQIVAAIDLIKRVAEDQDEEFQEQAEKNVKEGEKLLKKLRGILFHSNQSEFKRRYDLKHPKPKPIKQEGLF